MLSHEAASSSIPITHAGLCIHNIQKVLLIARSEMLWGDDVEAYVPDWIFLPVQTDFELHNLQERLVGTNELIFTACMYVFALLQHKP